MGGFYFGAFFSFLIIFASIAWFVLCIVLFFKIWHMCDDVKEILQILSMSREKEEG